MGMEVDGELELDNVVTGRYATVRTVQRQSSAVNLLNFSPCEEVRRLQDEVCSLCHWFATSTHMSSMGRMVICQCKVGRCVSLRG
jgi:hypothetical protein